MSSQSSSVAHSDAEGVVEWTENRKEGCEVGDIQGSRGQGFVVRFGSDITVKQEVQNRIRRRLLRHRFTFIFLKFIKT